MAKPSFPAHNRTVKRNSKYDSLSLARNLVFFLRFHQYLAADGFVSLINFSFNSSLKAHRHNLSSLVTKMIIKPLFVHHIASIPGGTIRRSSLASLPHQYMPFFASNHCPKIYPHCKTEHTFLFPHHHHHHLWLLRRVMMSLRPNSKSQKDGYLLLSLTERDNLLRNMEYKKCKNKRKILLNNAQDFEAPTSAPFAMGRKSEVEASSSNVKHATRNKGRRAGSNSKSKGCIKPKKENEVESHLDVECATALLDLSIEDKTEVQCTRALMEISGQPTSDCRASRRLAVLEPELRNDVVSTEPWSM